MRVGVIGCGTIGSFVLGALVDGKIPGAVAAGVCVRNESSPGAARAASFGVPVVTTVEDLFKLRPDVVMETASHQALEHYGAQILRAGVDLIPLSLGALVDQDLLSSLVQAAEEGGSYLRIPSGGIGGLDALQAVIEAGVHSVTLTSRKPPKAWRGIPYVESLGIDLASVREPVVLFEGSARDCVKKFPQNINIAAALSLSGVGFERTMVRILADPTITLNRHEIHCEGDAGKFTVVMENLPVPTNPKTSYLACLSAVATLRHLRSAYRIGT
jgi:aspartate dehydrogenase